MTQDVSRMRGWISVLIGLIVLLLLAVAGGAGYVWHERSEFEATLARSIAALRASSAGSTFASPADGKLSRPLLDRLLATRARVASTFATLAAFPVDPRDDGALDDLAHTWTRVQRHFALWPAVADALAAALTAEHMTIREYQWSARRMHRAWLAAATERKDARATAVREHTRETFVARSYRRDAEPFDFATTRVTDPSAAVDPTEIDLVLASLDALDAQPDGCLADVLALYVLPDYEAAH